MVFLEQKFIESFQDVYHELEPMAEEMNRKNNQES